MTDRLDRVALAARDDPRAVRAPERIVHIGLGAFHRAHQAWYTDRADDRAEWGIRSYTGRSPAAADRLAAQGGVYTLVERSDRDALSFIGSISSAIDGGRVDDLVSTVARPQISIITLTVTESGYRIGPDGGPDRTDLEIARDAELLNVALARRDLGLDGLLPTSVLGRLLLAMEARRRAGVGQLAVVPCDNVLAGGTMVRTALVRLAQPISPDLAAYVADEIEFVSTSVDRITPRTTSEDIARAARVTGFHDSSLVVTEPFSDWVLHPVAAAHPAWETAGARFVDDIVPFEQRKLQVLNGAHCLLAYAGLVRGHYTVAEAVADPVLRGWVEEYWDEVAIGLAAHPELELDGYREAIATRFENDRIEHRLDQIAMDGAAKLRVRIVPSLTTALEGGREPVGSLRVVASWVAARQLGLLSEFHGSAPAAERMVAEIDAELAADTRAMHLIQSLVAAVQAHSIARSES